MTPSLVSARLDAEHILDPSPTSVVTVFDHSVSAEMFISYTRAWPFGLPTPSLVDSFDSSFAKTRPDVNWMAGV